MRLLFAGTPAVAVPSLDRIAASGHQLIGVLTRPDAVAGRGRRLQRSPVAQWADQHGVPVFQPRRPDDPDFLQTVTELAPDCCPVVAYGALLPAVVLAAVPHGWINLHFSVLPAWRGAAPVQHAVLAGDDVTGASVFQIEQGLDTGPVFGVLTERVRPTDTAGDLLERLSVAGSELLVAVLDGIAAGALVAQAQPADGVSLAPKITVAQARVDWTQPAMVVDRQIRGCTPAPGAWTTLREERLKLGPVRLPGAEDLAPGESAPGESAPGELAVTRRAVFVGTGVGTGPVILQHVQAQGRQQMPAIDWARGLRLGPGEALQ